MSPMTRRILTLVACSPAVAFGAGAQRLAAPSFVFARYASGSATVLYAARSFGPVGAVVAMVQNPVSLYRELIAGTYTQLSWGRQSILVAAAYADATDGRYTQTYLNPTFVGGPLKFDATIEWYEPLERSGTRQLSVNPATLVVRVDRRLALGVASTLDVARGSTPPRRVGPVAEWTVKWGTLRVEVLHRTTGKATEVRTAVTAGF
jgi:hypothetical protein